jgi:hypothetical protein
MSEYLKYGAIGLGLALAVLAFLLLQREQKVARPRKEIVKTIYVFMGFALFLSVAGFLLEYAKSSQEGTQASLSSDANNRLVRIRAATVPLLNARVPVIESIPDNLPQKRQLLVFQEELLKILNEEEKK